MRMKASRTTPPAKIRGTFWKSDTETPCRWAASRRRQGLDQHARAIDTGHAHRRARLHVDSIADHVDDAVGEAGAARGAQRGGGDALGADQADERVAAARAAHGVV